jgi:hypothetical protein
MADDVPGLLRALLSGDADEADEALDGLFGSLCHQLSVYPASVYAVPFLARIAAAGIGAAGVLVLLGFIAKSTDERALEVPGSARTAVAAQVDVLIPLLREPNAQGDVPAGAVGARRGDWDRRVRHRRLGRPDRAAGRHRGLRRGGDALV